MTQELFARLAEPFPPERVSWRVGTVKKDGTGAMALAYIDARDVMDRLDAVCGPAGWQRRHPHVNGTTTCEIGLLVHRGADLTGIKQEWVWKADGAGDTAVEAEKGSLSDSFKRAAVNWGIGRYLYELPTPWVRIDQYKKILPEEMAKLESLLRRALPAQPATAPEVPQNTGGRKSAAQAKRDGDDASIKREIGECNREGLRVWHENFDRYTAHVPISWLDSIRDMLESRLIELNGADAVETAEAELDAGFSGAVGGGRAAPMAGNNGAVAV